MVGTSVVTPALPTPAVPGPPRAAVVAAPFGAGRLAAGAPAPWPLIAPQPPIARTRLAAVAGLGGPGAAVEVTLTGVPSVLEQIDGFPTGPVDGYPLPTT